MRNLESRDKYLEIIFLLEKSEGHAHGVDIAKRMNVSKASVSKTMKQFKKDGLILKVSYGTITLTLSGREIAKRVTNRKKLITDFLVKSLHVNKEEASKNAYEMKHHVSDLLMNTIIEYLKDAG